MISMGAAMGTGFLAGLGVANSRNLGSLDLKIQTARFRLRKHLTQELVSLSADAPPPVLFGRQGEPMIVNVTNTLNEYTAMHWHGIRLSNPMDGVPYLTQLPIAGGETFAYRFTPPDAGTYWYHPHCMTMTQIARGLTGLLVINEREDPGFDTEQVINLRDFRLGPDDQLNRPYSLRAASRSGTLGNVMTANWRQAPVYDHPTGSLVRMRIANTDTTRIHKLSTSGGKGRIIAWDGHPVEQHLPMPTLETPLVLGPGQRVDIALQMPGTEGEEIKLVSATSRGARDMTSLRAVGTSLGRKLAELRPLPRNPLSEPDLANAEIVEFLFGWSPDGSLPDNGFCGTLGQNFWAINRIPWPGDNAKGTGPLATLKRGKSYILRLRNESPNQHPIHLHGLAFKPVRSDKRSIAPYWTDTILLLKNETIDLALVADNPGDWAFHCHVIEHQKTGLAGYVRVT